MTPLRIVFMGTAEIARPSLQALSGDSNYQIVAIVTQPDKPSGRHLKETASAIKQFALDKNFPVLQPNRARDATFLEQVEDLSPELIVVMAYGQILPEKLLAIPKFGCLNIHTSLLPKYRGAAPIQWAIANGENETGVTIMKMDAGMDTGPILSQRTTPISEADNAQVVHDRLGELGAALLLETIPGYVDGKIRPQPQSEPATYAPKIKKEDGKLDWQQPAQVLWNRIRAFTPWPGTFTFLPANPKPLMLKIWRASVASESGNKPAEVFKADKNGIVVACGKNALTIHELQLEGGRRMNASEFILGHPTISGTCLT